MRWIVCVGWFAALITGAAVAQEATSSTGISGGRSRFGLGAQTAFNTGATSLNFVYDAGQFRAEGLLGVASVGGFGVGAGAGGRATNFNLGGRFFYVLHEVGRADFSLGGGLGLLFADRGASDINVGLEAGGQIRALIVENVALTSGLGFSFIFGDAPFSVVLGGQVMGTVGVVYFF